VRIEFFGLKDDLAKALITQALTKNINPRIDSVSVSFNHDPSFIFPQSDFRVLILWEPAAVMPWQYNSKNLSKFDLVIPMSSWRARRLGIKEFAYHPYDANGIDSISPFTSRQKGIVMVNSAKFSAGKSSLYGLRRATSKALAESEINYCLFGSNWKMSRIMELRKRFVALRNSIVASEEISWRELTSQLWYQYPEYSGWIDNKFEVLSQYELSLVIENEIDWVTEKIFDSIYSGTVPVYVGPDLSHEFPLLESCVIRADSTVEGVLAAVRSATKEQIAFRKRAIEMFVNDQSENDIDFWSPKIQWGHVSKIIEQRLYSA
jgi:hypothetical protein